VTGSTSGTGFTIASLFAREGAAIVVNGRSQNRVDEAIQSNQREHKNAMVTGIAADLGTSKGVDKLTPSFSFINKKI